MFKNVDGQFIDVELVLRADGNDATGLTPTVRIKKDGGAWGASAGVVKEGENGSYEYAPTQPETNADHVVFKFTATGAITTLVNVYPIVRDDYKADVSNLDVAVSSRSSHSAADAGTSAASKVLATPANLLATGAAGEVTTDAASRTASQADVSGLATAAELANVPKKGLQSWTHENGEQADVTIAQT